MVLYRFNHLSQTLKATSAGLFSVSLANTAAGAPKYVYKPFLVVPRTTTVAVANSTHDHHDPGYHGPYGEGSPKGNYMSIKFEGWEKWKSWKDVPDHLIPTSSWRDPDNPIYAHPKYVKMRKQQLFAQRPCGLPVYLRTTEDRYLYYVIVVMVAICLLNAWYNQYTIIYKTPYPDHNLFYFF